MDVNSKQITGTSKIQEWLLSFNSIRPKYDLLVTEITYILKIKLKELNIRVASISGRTKSSESLRNKIEKKSYKENPLEQATDLAGVRVVCYYESDLPKIQNIVLDNFVMIEHVDKTGDLGVDKMGYHGSHFVVMLGDNYRGPRYDGLISLKCEIQTRTALQDAWALISHHLIYKDESSIPSKIKRDLNNVASLLEVAQGIFDIIRNKRENYLGEIHGKENVESEFLDQPIDYDTLVSYINKKYPDYDIEDYWHTRFIADINHNKYKSLRDINNVVILSKPAVEKLQSEHPHLFTGGTDFLTKSFGFVDIEFRNKHDWADITFRSFKRLGHLVKNNEKTEQNG